MRTSGRKGLDFEGDDLLSPGVTAVGPGDWSSCWAAFHTAGILGSEVTWVWASHPLMEFEEQVNSGGLYDCVRF